MIGKPSSTSHEWQAICFDKWTGPERHSHTLVQSERRKRHSVLRFPLFCLPTYSGRNWEWRFQSRLTRRRPRAAMSKRGRQPFVASLSYRLDRFFWSLCKLQIQWMIPISEDGRRHVFLYNYILSSIETEQTRGTGTIVVWVELEYTEELDVERLPLLKYWHSLQLNCLALMTRETKWCRYCWNRFFDSTWFPFRNHSLLAKSFVSIGKETTVFKTQLWRNDTELF